MCYFFLIVIFERETDRQSISGGGQRERETQKLKQAPGSELSAQNLTQNWNPQTTRSLPELETDAYMTEPPRRPSFFLFLLETLDPLKTSHICLLKKLMSKIRFSLLFIFLKTEV